jgi:hypothetical protein
VCRAVRSPSVKRDSERGPAKQFTGSVLTDVIAAPSQSSPVAVYSRAFRSGPACSIDLES